MKLGDLLVVFNRICLNDIGYWRERSFAGGVAPVAFRATGVVYVVAF